MDDGNPSKLNDNSSRCRIPFGTRFRDVKQLNQHETASREDFIWTFSQRAALHSDVV
jgi:hypothetical protein